MGGGGGVPGFLSVGVSQGFFHWGVETILVAKSQIGSVIIHVIKISQPPLRLCALICCQQVLTAFHNTVAYIDIN